MDRIRELQEENKRLTLALIQLQMKILSFRIAQDRIKIEINERLIEIEEIQEKQ